MTRRVGRICLRNFLKCLLKTSVTSDNLNKVVRHCREIARLKKCVIPLVSSPFLQPYAANFFPMFSNSNLKLEHLLTTR